MTVARFARLVAVAPAVGAVPAILVCVALRLAVPPESIQAILMEGVIVGAVYAVAVCAFGLECGVRSRYLDHVRQLFDVVLVRMKPDATGVGAQPS
jgi:hypothetical protein